MTGTCIGRRDLVGKQEAKEIEGSKTSALGLFKYHSKYR